MSPTCKQINQLFDLLSIPHQAFEPDDVIPHLLTLISELVDREMNMAVTLEQMQEEIDEIKKVMDGRLLPLAR